MLKPKGPVKITCPVCDNPFERRRAEFNRSERTGRVSYCSRACGKVAVNHAENLGKFKGCWRDPAAREGSGCKPGNPGNKGRTDRFTGAFRYFSRKSKTRKPDSTLTPEEVEAQWKLQEGRCAYSGIQLTLPTRKLTIPKVLQASLDRTDSAKTYQKGNIQFISCLLNYAKNDLPDEEFREAMAILGLCERGADANPHPLSETPSVS